MAEIMVEGTNLGYEEKPYDFTNDAGEQVKGVSRRPHVLSGTEVIDFRVPDERVAEARALPLKAEVTVRASLPKGARITFVEAAS